MFVFMETTLSGIGRVGARFILLPCVSHLQIEDIILLFLLVNWD